MEFLMKFIHCADIHLGSKMEAKLPKAKADERKAEVRASFNRMVNYARDNGIGVILLSGDVFDSDRPLKRDKEFFYSVVRANSQIHFFYLRGNHDSLESFNEGNIANLYTFSNEWTAFSVGDVVICGIESTEENATSMYSSLKLDGNKFNVVMLHGQIGDTSGKDRINISKLRNKNIDYLALGHIHTLSTAKLDDRGVYAYSGCLEGRGFDETGDKGFIVADTDGGLKLSFVSNSFRKIEEFTVDVSGARDTYAIYTLIKRNIKCDCSSIVRINIVGDVSFDDENLANELEKLLSRDYYFVEIKNKTRRAYNANMVEGDVSIRGEFIRTVLSLEGYTDEEKDKIISKGLKALSGREVDS
jgi:DNA repair exonuclease SbcCD nuclease subunit